MIRLTMCVVAVYAAGALAATSDTVWQFLLVVVLMGLAGAYIPLPAESPRTDQTGDTMATVDLRTLPLSEQHHSNAFNSLSRTGRRATDFLWICPECDDGVTHAPMSWTGRVGFFHVADGASDDLDAKLHQLVAVDVIAVLEAWRGMGFHLKFGTRPDSLNIDGMLELGAPLEVSDRA